MGRHLETDFDIPPHRVGIRTDGVGLGERGFGILIQWMPPLR